MAEPTPDALTDRIALLQAEIAGIAIAHGTGPSSLAPGDLPAFVNFIGAETIDTSLSTEDWIVSDQEIIMRLYVVNVQQGISKEAENRVKVFLWPVEKKMMSAPTLRNLQWVERAYYLGHGGIQVLDYEADNYLGAEFRLNVRRRYLRCYERNE